MVVRPPASLEEVRARLIELTQLEKGWDGDKGLPTSRRAADKALELAEVLLPKLGAVYVVPGSGGDVQLEWHQDGFDIELWIQVT